MTPTVSPARDYKQQAERGRLHVCVTRTAPARLEPDHPSASHFCLSQRRLRRPTCLDFSHASVDRIERALQGHAEVEARPFHYLRA